MRAEAAERNCFQEKKPSVDGKAKWNVSPKRFLRPLWWEGGGKAVVAEIRGWWKTFLFSEGIELMLSGDARMPEAIWKVSNLSTHTNDPSSMFPQFPSLFLTEYKNRFGFSYPNCVGDCESLLPFILSSHLLCTSRSWNGWECLSNEEKNGKMLKMVGRRKRKHHGEKIPFLLRGSFHSLTRFLLYILNIRISIATTRNAADGFHYCSSRFNFFPSARSRFH